MAGKVILSEVGIHHSRLNIRGCQPHTRLPAMHMRSIAPLRAAADASSLETKSQQDSLRPTQANQLDSIIQTKQHIDSLTVDARAAFLDGQNSDGYLGDRGYQEYFVNQGGNRICGYFWPAAAQPKGVILLTHGMGSYLCFEYLLNQVRGPAFHS